MDIKLHVDNPFLSDPVLYPCSAFSEVSENLTAIQFVFFPSYRCNFSLHTFQIISLSLFSRSLNMMHFGGPFFGFTLFGVHSVS